ncbi:MAG: sulfotransferase domain-containing protein [Phycisphaerae bacterium]|nr:sulfotransferase domain-containing protein [Phycisphaerae bacterium]MCK6497917.1 sulfotransferase domain-containing protein [Nitrospira sp.]
MTKIDALTAAVHSSGAPGAALLTIRYQDLLADPTSHADRIIVFLGLAIRPEQRQAAIKLIEPARKRH